MPILLNSRYVPQKKKTLGNKRCNVLYSDSASIFRERESLKNHINQTENKINVCSRSIWCRRAPGGSQLSLHLLFPYHLFWVSEPKVSITTVGSITRIIHQFCCIYRIYQRFKSGLLHLLDPSTLNQRIKSIFTKHA